MRVLIAGGAGFLGYHLVNKHLKMGHQVICVDNLSSGTKARITPFLTDKNYNFIEHDIINPLNVVVDRIYNLACPASPVRYQADPIHTTKTSVIGTLNLLELARALGIPFFHTSTSEVYGDPSVSPQSESYWGHVNPIGIRSCYDEGKRCAESLCFDFFRQYALDVRVVRIFNTYGPKMDTDDGRVVSNFVVQALLGQPITVYGSGRQTRSFCFVTDMIEGIEAMMRFGSPDIGPVNLGNPNEMSVGDLAELVVKMVGSRSPIVFKPLPLDDPLQRKPDITLAIDSLSWRPSIEITDGLAATIEYFRQDLNLK